MSIKRQTVLQPKAAIRLNQLPPTPNNSNPEKVSTKASIPIDISQDELPEDLWQICCQISQIRSNDIVSSSSPNDDTCQGNRTQLLRLALKELIGGVHELHLPAIIPFVAETTTATAAAITSTTTGHKSTSDSLISQFISAIPALCRKVCEKVDTTILINNLFPDASIFGTTRELGTIMTWWACLVDDLIEALEDDVYHEAVDYIRKLLNGTITDLAPECHQSVKIVFTVSQAFLECVNAARFFPLVNGKIQETKEKKWRASFFKTLQEFLTAFDAERPATSKILTLQQWMKIRVTTIGARPFMVLARASLKLPTNLSNHGFLLRNRVLRKPVTPNPLEQMEILVQLIMGMENDIFGWEKDHKLDNQLSAIEIPLSQGMNAQQAFTSALQVHNGLVGQLLAVCQYKETNSTKLDTYQKILLGFPYALAAWTSGAKRYQVR